MKLWQTGAKDPALWTDHDDGSRRGTKVDTPAGELDERRRILHQRRHSRAVGDKSVMQAAAQMLSAKAVGI
ncbi:hypothetical protein ACVWYH_002006 [Bradyrhizobium sp. GM24.11]